MEPGPGDRCRHGIRQRLAHDAARRRRTRTSSASSTRPRSSARTACPTRCSSTPSRRTLEVSHAIIAGAGGAAHLPGMLAAKTTVPVLGVPAPSRHLSGQDSLLSIVQMPAGVPTATFAIGDAGATNAALFAVAMLAIARRRAARAARSLPCRTARCRSIVGAAPTRMTSSPVPILPPATIGMLGGGQLGKYALAAANAMGYRTVVVDPDPGAPARVVADVHVVAAYDDSPTLEHLADELLRGDDRVRKRPGRGARPPRRIGAGCTFGRRGGSRAGPDRGEGLSRRPRRRRSDRTSQHRSDLDPTQRRRGRTSWRGPERSSRPPDSATTARDSVACRVAPSSTPPWPSSPATTASSKRCSISAPRSASSSRAPRTAPSRAGRSPRTSTSTASSICPWPRLGSPTQLAARATELAVAVAEHLAYVGVLAVEMFVVGDDQLLVNEIAPRPHNSGHWTLDASADQPVRTADPCGVRRRARRHRR